MKILKTLTFMCTNIECRVSIQWVKLAQHDMTDCQHRKAECTICQTLVSVYELDSHRRVCNEYVRDIQCQRCGDTVKNTLVQQHLKTCMKA